jgi:hypothetical protein
MVDVLEARVSLLGSSATAAGVLRGRMDALGLTAEQIAQRAILPEDLIVAWLAGEHADPPPPTRWPAALLVTWTCSSFEASTAERASRGERQTLVAGTRRRQGHPWSTSCR